jgi:hypothetical protein
MHYWLNNAGTDFDSSYSLQTTDVPALFGAAQAPWWRLMIATIISSWDEYQSRLEGSKGRERKQGNAEHPLEPNALVFSECESVGCVRERSVPSDRRLSAKLVSNFADRGCYVVSAANPLGRIPRSLDRSRYVFFQVAPQLHSRGKVDPVPDPLLLRKWGSAGNRARTSGSVARNSDHWICEHAVSVRICGGGRQEPTESWKRSEQANVWRCEWIKADEV